MNSLAPSRSSQRPFATSCGFTYVEMLITLAIAALIIAGLSGVVGQALQSQDAVSETNKLTRDARFAMQRMLRTISSSRRLILPLKDNPNTNWPEHIREQKLPPSPPIAPSTLATAVLAVTLPADVDLDSNSVADADNDADGLIDEDHGGDMNNDGAPGIIGIDDDGDGAVDESDADLPERDDDEEAGRDEDFADGVDDDADGSEGEDGAADNNKDFEPGIAGVDDDADGSVDEEHFHDDDEDGAKDEDWLDAVVFFLAGSELRERTPVPWDTNADAVISGADFIESIIAENVTRFRVERLDNGSAVEVIDLTLELTSPVTGESVSLQSQVRVGGGL